MKNIFKIPEDYPGFFSSWKNHSPGWIYLSKLIPQSLKTKKFRLNLIIALLIFLIFYSQVAWIYQVPTASMKNTLQVGDVFLVNKLHYGISTPAWFGFPDTKIGKRLHSVQLIKFSQPKNGDIIVFRFPRDPGQIFVKRIAAVGGQVIEIERKRVYIDGVEQPLPPNAQLHFARSIPPRFHDPTIYPPDMNNRDYYGPLKVPEGFVFVLGDNRNHSMDSRFWGFLPEEYIIGKAMIVVASMDNSKSLAPKDRIRWQRFGRWIF